MLNHKTLLTALLLLVAAPLASFAACSSPEGEEGAVIYNSTAKMLQFCNGTVWVNAAGIAAGAGGGGGKPTYAGVTSATTTGAPTNYLKGLDAMCASEYAGSRMMRSSDFKYVAADITSSTTGWIHCDSMAGDTSKGQCADFGAWVPNYPDRFNCQGWSTTSYYGLTYVGSSGYAGVTACNSAYAIHCVTD